MSDLIALTDAIKAGKHDDATAVTRRAIEDGTPPQTILDALIAGMDDVGRRFKGCEVFVPEVLIAARAMKLSMALLQPLLVEAGIRPERVAVIGTVRGDLHDIGKNLVSMMWRGANFEVVDLGTDVSPERFVEAAREHHATICGLSALLTTTMGAMRTTVKTIRDAGLAEVRVLVGGAPITQKFADEIGADGFAPDAAAAVDVARAVAVS